MSARSLRRSSRSRQKNDNQVDEVVELTTDDDSSKNNLPPRRSTRNRHAPISYFNNDDNDDEESENNDDNEELVGTEDHEDEDEDEDDNVVEESEDDISVAPERRNRGEVRRSKRACSIKSKAIDYNEDRDDNHLDDFLDDRQMEEEAVTDPEHETPAGSSGGEEEESSDAEYKEDDSIYLVDTDEDDDEEDVGDSELEEIKILRILASRTESLGEWREICKDMNTSEIQNGSRWIDTRADKEEDDAIKKQKFLIKWRDLSHIHCSWETREDIFSRIENANNNMIMFRRRSIDGFFYTPDERNGGDYFDPAFLKIDRIVQVLSRDGIPIYYQSDMDCLHDHDIVFDRNDPAFDVGTGCWILIKWKNCGYAAMTYEYERDLLENGVSYEEQLLSFFHRIEKPSRTQFYGNHDNPCERERRRLYKIFGEKSSLSGATRDSRVAEFQSELGHQEFPNGGKLRDYQAVGVSWMISNYINHRSCILADEMGLGKTIQTCSFIDILANKMGRRGPFLIVAPLSTISQWEREFKAWTNLNTVVYYGSPSDREACRQYEFAYSEDRPEKLTTKNFLRKCRGRGNTRFDKIWMAQVVITTPAVAIADDSSELAVVDWEVLVVDEAHRMKNRSSKLTSRLGQFSYSYSLLLTGTPIQNDMTELWTLLNIIDKEEFHNLDRFLDKYGNMKSKETVDELHGLIRPYLLRRLKEDVEKNLPIKGETAIEVELTVAQKKYYRALYERNIKFLNRNNKKACDGPSLNNLAMQLRKCCNHPFLLKGVESDLEREERKGKNRLKEGDFLVKYSGKLVLLDKLLPRLQEKGHRVLLFSQFKIMLDIIEDYLVARQFTFERVDGGITGAERQQAIDRFQAPEGEGKEPPLVMLLSTRAGGVGINLTAADTCIIFDSDWNPQNDLQAQARCHRIGQTKDVQVYRLLAKKTYEMKMFHLSSLKMGLDNAVLKGFESGKTGEGSLSKEEVEKLLRYGAYDVFNEDKNGKGDEESRAFVDEDIDQILEERTRKIIHENSETNGASAGSTFSKASFKAAKTPGMDGNEDVDIDDPNFWTKMIGAAPTDDEVDPFQGKKRARKIKNYSEVASDKEFEKIMHDNSDDGDTNAPSVTSPEATGTTNSDNESVYSDAPIPDDESESDLDLIVDDCLLGKQKKATKGYKSSQPGVDNNTSSNAQDNNEPQTAGNTNQNSGFGILRPDPSLMAELERQFGNAALTEHQVKQFLQTHNLTTNVQAMEITAAGTGEDDAEISVAKVVVRKDKKIEKRESEGAKLKRSSDTTDERKKKKKAKKKHRPSSEMNHQG